jgi:hypothetical protein
VISTRCTYRQNFRQIGEVIKGIKSENNIDILNFSEKFGKQHFSWVSSTRIKFGPLI